MLHRTAPIHRRIAPGAVMLMITNLVVAGTVAEPAVAFDPFADLRRDEPVEVTPLEPGRPAMERRRGRSPPARASDGGVRPGHDRIGCCAG
jgi:hypothetical protein